VRLAAAEALEKLEAIMDIEHILGLLKDGGRGGRVRALYALEKVNSPRAFPPLRAALKSPDPDIRGVAVQMLGKKKNPKTLEHLVRHLRDPHPAVRVHAAEALGYFSDRRLVPYLAAVLVEGEANLVIGAIRSLAAIGAPDAEKSLLPLLDDPRPAVRREAARAIGELEVDS
jgi:HEAT repeat protein